MSLVEISFFMPLMVMLQCASLTVCMLDNFSCFFFASADYFQNQLFPNSFWKTIRVSICQTYFGPGSAGLMFFRSSCLHMLSTDDTSKQRIQLLQCYTWIYPLLALINLDSNRLTDKSF